MQSFGHQSGGDDRDYRGSRGNSGYRGSGRDYGGRGGGRGRYGGKGGAIDSPRDHGHHHHTAASNAFGGGDRRNHDDGSFSRGRGGGRGGRGRGRGGGEGRGRGRGRGRGGRGRGGRGRGGGGDRRKRKDMENDEPLPEPLVELEPFHRLYNRLIDAELDEERRQIHNRLEAWPLRRLQSEGFAILNLSARTHGRFFGDTIVRLSSSTHPTLPMHKFSQGDMVTLCRSNPLKHIDAEGVVMLKTKRMLQIVVKDCPRDLRVGAWRLDRGANTVAHDRMAAALKHTVDKAFKGPDWLRQLVSAAGLGYEPSTGGGNMPLLPGTGAASAFAEPASLERWLADRMTSVRAGAVMANGEMLDGVDEGCEGLNATQLAAVRGCLSHPFGLIQGPPGTGKTTTAVKLIRAWKRARPTAGPVLAIAQSNIAVDQLLSGLVGAGLNAVRVGHPVKVLKELRDSTLDARLERHPKTAEIQADREKLFELSNNMHTFHGRDRGMAHRDLSVGWKAVRAAEATLSAEVVSQCDVVCATCIGSGSDLLASSTFEFIVCDEATQATLPETLVGLQRLAPHGSAVLVGDHRQLPPTVMSPQATQLQCSLFDACIALADDANMTPDHSKEPLAISNATSLLPGRVHQATALPAGVLTSHMLGIQYRMHPALSAWPAGMFYGGKLKDGVGAEQRTMSNAWMRVWPRGVGSRGALSPVVFINVRSGREESEGGSGKSRINSAEATQVLQWVKRWMDEGGVQASSIGIISPYSAQVRKLVLDATRAGVGEVRSDVIQPAQRSAFTAGGEIDNDDVDEEEEEEYQGLEIKTVDGFQGREKDIIVLSTVRASSEGGVGFLADYRRLNVAITRAKYGVVVVGHRDTLSRDAIWRSWLQWVGEHGCVVDV